jgi:hypothetical protein
MPSNQRCDLPDASSNTTSQIGNGFSGGFWTLNQYFAEFDTSAIPDSDSLESASFTIHNTAENNGSEDQWTLELRSNNWGGGTVTNSDWVDLSTATNWTNLPLLAYAPKPVGINPNADPINFTSTDQFVDEISKTGSTYVSMLINYEYDVNPISFASERVVFYSGDSANPPTLTVTHCFTLPCTSPTPTPTPTATQIELTDSSFTPIVVLGGLFLGVVFVSLGESRREPLYLLLGAVMIPASAIALEINWLTALTGMAFIALAGRAALISDKMTEWRNRNNFDGE